MRLNDLGRVVAAAWEDLPNHYESVELGTFVVMPNHVHGIITIAPPACDAMVGAGLKPAHPVDGALARAGLKPAPTLSELVRAFKTFSARRINAIRCIHGVAVWQRNYYEHIIRDDDALIRIREYIVNNPMHWALDRENPKFHTGVPETRL